VSQPCKVRGWSLLYLRIRAIRMIVRITINMPMKTEIIEYKIVKNKDSINIILDESVYYAKGINKVRKLKGEKIKYKYLK
jgi:hypothetical protein